MKTATIQKWFCRYVDENGNQTNLIATQVDEGLPDEVFLESYETYMQQQNDVSVKLVEATVFSGYLDSEGSFVEVPSKRRTIKGENK